MKTKTIVTKNNPWIYFTKEQKKKHKQGLKRLIRCPHCGKIGKTIGMNRWHFDNCKYKTIGSVSERNEVLLEEADMKSLRIINKAKDKAEASILNAKATIELNEAILKDLEEKLERRNGSWDKGE